MQLLLCVCGAGTMPEDRGRETPGFASAASCLGMDDLDAFLNDDAMEEAEPDPMTVCTCDMCGTTSTSKDPVCPTKLIRFSKKNKDHYCHLVHMHTHGEKVWAAPRLC